MNAPVKHILGTAHDLAKWRAQVDRAIRGDCVLTFEKLASAIEDGRMYLFTTEDSFVIVQPQGEVGNMQIVFVVGGGTQPGLEALVLPVTIWGRMIGATKMLAHARRGLAPRFIKQGWKHSLTVIEKEI